MKSRVHSPLTGNHPLAGRRIYSDLFREAGEGGGQQKQINKHIFPN